MKIRKNITHNELLKDIDIFKRLMGKLIYITITKVDIAYVVRIH
jgi:hypothetical protein